MLGCATTTDVPLSGKPIYFKNINDDVFWENIIVFGYLERETIRQPTSSYASSFGHAYCMAQDISFRAKNYIQGSGPNLIEFTQHVVDSCQSLSTDIGLQKAILFLSKNEHRGIWSTGNVRVFNLDGEGRIVDPLGINMFSSLENFDALLSEYSEPFEWGEAKSWETYETLNALKDKAVLDFELVKSSWPKLPEPRSDEAQAYDEYYQIKMYKYIKLNTLLESNF